MLTWDETKAAVHEAQTTSKEDFERHLADYIVQDAVGKLIDDYVKITFARYGGVNEETAEIVAHEAAIFMTGVQVGWYMAEHAFKRS
jgi:hypothetical protein